MELNPAPSKQVLFCCEKKSSPNHPQLIFHGTAVVKGVEHISSSSPAGFVGRDLNLQKLNYQYLTTSVAVVLVVR